MGEADRYYSLALRLVDRPVVIVGGDAEATAKVEAMLAAGARVTVVATEVTERLAQWAAEGAIRHVVREYQSGDLQGAALAFVCEVRHAAAAREEADRHRVWLNVVDVPPMCDFIATAQFARDGLQISIHSSGKSAALSRRVRQRLQREFGPSFAELTRALGELRPAVRALIADAALRRAFWLEVVDETLVDRVCAGEFASQPFKDETLRRAQRWSSGCPETAEGTAPR